MKKMFDWIIKVGTSVLDTKKELLAILNKRENIDIPLERYFYQFCHIKIVTYCSFFIL